MSTALQPDPLPSPVTTEAVEDPTPDTSVTAPQRSRASRRLDHLAALLRGTHDHRIPF